MISASQVITKYANMCHLQNSNPQDMGKCAIFDVGDLVVL